MPNSTATPTSPAIVAGNSKLRAIPNVSLPPLISCGAGVPCRIGCYALKFARIYPSARAAWRHNLDLYRRSPADYFGGLDAYLGRRRPERFRWHVAGDIPDKPYLHGMRRLARRHLGVRFLAFTKRYAFSYRQLPANLSVMLSTWPNAPLPSGHRHLRRCWVTPDDRAPADAWQCPGDCHACRACWIVADLGRDVAIAKH